jgi:peptidoglycan hydrolase-like protein with peptidoglycan-binding domain
MAWFKCAARREITNNLGGSIGTNLGLILHHAVANGSLYSFFNNPSAQVSAHFWVAQDGRIEQYVDTNRVAWHAKQLNGRYVGVETEGCTNPANGYADPMSEAMIDALARIYAEGMAVHGWKNALANSDGQPGFGFHRMAVNTACPCDTRLNMRPEILKRATGQAPSTGAPPSSGSAPPAGGPAPPFPGTLLRNLTQGHGASTWQGQMAARGWSLSVDGVYGPESERVCRSFQSEKGLGVDGVVGPETWAAAWTAPIT